MNKPAQFTPGPLKAVQIFIENSPCTWAVQRKNIREQWGKPSIATYIDNEADARLFAAAPVMYADLCAVRDYLFELYDEGNAKAGEYAASLGITIEQAEGQHHE